VGDRQNFLTIDARAAVAELHLHTWDATDPTSGRGGGQGPGDPPGGGIHGGVIRRWTGRPSRDGRSRWVSR